VSLSRRSFLADSSALALASSLLLNPENGFALDAPAAGAHTPPTAGEDYWKSLYAGSAERSRGGTKTPNTGRDPRIAYYDGKSSLVWAEDIKAATLPSFTEDAVVTVELTGFRSGSQDKSSLAKVRFAQLHLSCQRVTGSEFLGPLVWATLATLFTSKASSLPSEQSLTWGALTSNPMQPASPNPSTGSGPQLSHVVLNQGAGHMALNITTTPTNSALDKVLGYLITGTKILTPLLGFPGIALPALENFYTFYGQIETAHAENFLLNSSNLDVAVTQQGADNSLISADALKLVTGDYIVVPKTQEDDFQKGMSDLVVNNGYLVNKDSKDAPDQRVAEAVPTVSYVTLHVNVQKASDFPATSTVTDPMLDAAPSPSGAKSSTHTTEKKTQ
jgi:hypothetical protein